MPTNEYLQSTPGIGNGVFIGSPAMTKNLHRGGQVVGGGNGGNWQRATTANLGYGGGNGYNGTMSWPGGGIHRHNSSSDDDALSEVKQYS